MRRRARVPVCRILRARKFYVIGLVSVDDLVGPPFRFAKDAFVQECTLSARKRLQSGNCPDVSRHVRYSRVGVGRLLVLGTAICAAVTVVTVAPHSGLIDGSAAQQAALETAALLIALLAGFLVFGRLQRSSGLGELLLVTSL